MKRRAPSRGDDGAVLLIALAILFLFGVALIPLVLSNAEIGLRTTSILRSRDEKVYAADAGLEHGIDELRRVGTSCVSPTGPFNFGNLSPITVDGRSESINVEVTCELIEGVSLGALGYAVITTQPSDTSLQTQGSNDSQCRNVPPPEQCRSVDGPVFAGGVPNNRDTENPQFSLLVRNANVLEHKSDATCNGPGDKNDLLNAYPTPPFHYVCTDEPSPYEALRGQGLVRLPTELPPVIEAAPGDPDGDGCTVFSPGTYDGADPDIGPVLALTARNYFQSGTYYFKNIELLVNGNKEVVGGEPRDPDEAPINLTNAGGGPGAGKVVPCATDPSDMGTGVKFILGGTSTLTVDNQGGQGNVELFMRCLSGGDEHSCDPGRDSATPADGTLGMSLMTVPDADFGEFAPSTVTYVGGTPVVRVGGMGGSNPQLTFHGLVYAPEGFVDFQATHVSEAQLRAGIVAGRLRLQSSESASGLVVSVKNRPGVRKIVVTARAAGESGNQGAVSRAVVELSNKPGVEVKINSWQSCVVDLTKPPEPGHSWACPP